MRRLAGRTRVGHAGTLDPLADGVLPVLLGRATRLAEWIQAGEKTYRAIVCLGTSTETDDAEGSVVSVAAVPAFSEARLREVLADFQGEVLQTPPSYSALKVGGRRAYAVARAGGEVDLAPRRVSIHELRLVDWTATELRLEVTCSKGTYIRALARDIAATLGTVGHLGGLTRTRVGPFFLEQAIALEQLAEHGIDPLMLPPSRAIPDASTWTTRDGEAARLVNGQPIGADGLRADAVWVYDPDGRLVCLASADGVQLRPRLLL